jgi:hypothetical protein
LFTFGHIYIEQMKKHLLFFALVFATLLTLAQPVVVDTSNVAASVNSSGALFRGIDGMSGFEFPKGSGVHTMYSSALWLAAMDQNNQLHTAAAKFGMDQEDFYPGPLTVDGTASTTASVMETYDRVWLANATDVERHLLFLESVNNGTFNDLFPDGYQAPQWFNEWPAMGDVAAGQDLFLAPFMDYDGDLVYVPENGDYPLFPGDECAYFIMNDRGGVHELSQGEPLGVEIHCFVYSFNDALDQALNNSIFVRYEIINRSTQSFSDVYAGIWSDLDIGNPTDDYVGSHVSAAAYYGYNGDSFDEASAVSLGYGAEIPVQAVAILNGPLLPANEADDELPAALEGYETYGAYGTGFGDGVMDNERLGLTSFLYHVSGTNPVSGDPNTANDFYNYLTSTWQDGSLVVHGGNGNGSSTSVPSKYMFSGTSDPAFLGTSGVEVDAWTEETALNMPSDRRGMGAMGPFELAPGAHQTIDVVYAAIAHESTSSTVEQQVEDIVIDLREAFFGSIYSEIPSVGITVGMEELSAKSAVVRMYPNPAEQLVSFLHPAGTRIEIYSADGKLAAQWLATATSSQMDVDQLQPGIYVVKASGKTTSHSEMLIVR